MAMSKEQQQLVMVGVLIVVLAVVMMNSFKPKKREAPAPAAAPAVEVKPPPAPSGAPAKTEDKSVGSQKDRSDKLAWGRNPFVAFEEKAIEGTGFTLKGISIGKGRKGYAFINDEIVRKGDKFMGYEIAEIEKDKVLLRKEGSSFYIVFPPEE